MSDFLAFAKEFLAEKYNVHSSSFRTSYSITRSFVNSNAELFDDTNSSTLKPYVKFIDNAPKILHIIETSKSSQETKRKLLLFFALLLKKLNEEKLHVQYLKLYRKIKYNIIDQRKTNVPRGYKEIQCLDISLRKLRNQPINHKKLDAKTLLYNLLIYIDETPRLDYRTLKYNPSTSNSNNGNYLKYSTRKNSDCNVMIVLNDYKTSRKYGTWTIKIKHNQLCEYINKYIKHNNLKSNQHIFLNANHKPFSSNKFSEFVQNVFKGKLGVKISINCLRIMKENQLFHQNPDTLNWSLKEKEDWVVNHFRHSLATSRLYYQRINSNGGNTNNSTNNSTNKNTHSGGGEIVGLSNSFDDDDDGNGSNNSRNTKNSTNNANSKNKKGKNKQNSSKKKYKNNKSGNSSNNSRNTNNDGGNYSNSSNDNNENTEHYSHHSKKNKMIKFETELNDLMQKYNVGKPQVRKLISKQVLI